MVFDKFNLGKRGQLSVEFILIVLVVLVLIEAIIIPLRDYSENSVKDVLTVSYLEQDISKIQSAISSLNAYDQGKITVNVHIPEDANMLVIKNNNGDLNILYAYSYFSKDMNYSNCDTNICYANQYLGKYNLSPDEINQGYVSGFGLYGPIDTTLAITKINNEITISK